MPIYDLSYRHWEGQLRSGAGRWWVIAEAGLRLLLAKRFFLFLLMVCWIPVFIEAFYVYFELAMGQGTGLGIGPWFFQYAFAWQLPALVLVTIYAGSGLIASDLAANALPIYFSKPITRIDYVVGKLIVIASLLTAVFLAPVVVLFLFTVGVDPNLEFVKANWWMAFSIMGYGAAVVLVCSLFILALSSMAHSGRVVGVTFMAVAIFSPAVGQILSLITGSDQVLVFSAAHNISRLSDAFFWQQASVRLSPVLSVAAAVAVSLWSAWILSRRIRPVEIVRMTTTVHMDNIAKWYGQVVAVNGVSLDVRPGVTGLLGPNGAGKSTLMKILTGQLKQSRGDCTVAGHRPWNNPEMNRVLGFCPEQDTFYEWMTGRRFVRALLSLNGYAKKEVERRAEAAIDEVGMTDVADGKIAGYSKGMRQRIKLAQAIAHDPEIVVLDEPVTGLDPIGRRHIIDLVRKWGDEGRTVLVSSHILHEVEAMTSTVLLINHGRLLAEGNVHEIRDLIDEHPHHVTLTTGDPRSLAARLIAEKDVVSVRFDEHSRNVTAETVKPDAFYSRIPALVLQEGVEVDELSSPDDNLSAVFDYLVK